MLTAGVASASCTYRRGHGASALSIMLLLSLGPCARQLVRDAGFPFKISPPPPPPPAEFRTSLSSNARFVIRLTRSYMHGFQPTSQQASQPARQRAQQATSAVCRGGARALVFKVEHRSRCSTTGKGRAPKKNEKATVVQSVFLADTTRGEYRVLVRSVRPSCGFNLTRRPRPGPARVVQVRKGRGYHCARKLLRRAPGTAAAVGLITVLPTFVLLAFTAVRFKGLCSF